MSHAALNITSPGQLINWHYFGYAAVALLLMVVVIASGHLWSLNFVHVFCIANGWTAALAQRETRSADVALG
jgi:hypothetical protein